MPDERLLDGHREDCASCRGPEPCDCGWTPELLARMERDYAHLQNNYAIAERYIEHLRADHGRHGDCRIKTGPGTYQCRFRVEYEEARS